MKCSTPRRTVNLERVEHATYEANAHARTVKKRLESFEKDSDAAARMREHECRTCWYLYGATIAMQAFTQRDCDICGEEQTYSSSDTRPICLACAVRNKLCRACCGRVSMKRDARFTLKLPEVRREQQDEP